MERGGGGLNVSKKRKKYGRGIEVSKSQGGMRDGGMRSEGGERRGGEV